MTSLAPIRITATSGSVGSARSIWRVEVRGHRADDGEAAQVHPAVRLLGQPAGQLGAGRLLDPVDAVPGGTGVAEQRDLDRRPGTTAAVPAGRVRRVVVEAADGLAGDLGLDPEHAVQGSSEQREAASAVGGGGRQLACSTRFPHAFTLRSDYQPVLAGFTHT